MNTGTVHEEIIRASSPFWPYLNYGTVQSSFRACSRAVAMAYTVNAWYCTCPDVSSVELGSQSESILVHPESLCLSTVDSAHCSEVSMVRYNVHGSVAPAAPGRLEPIVIV